MSFFPEEKVSEVRDRSNILEVVSDYVNLKKTGRNYKGLCPFHSEKTPSFMINEEKQIFHCFGCGEGGDVFKFLMKVGNFSFPQAVEELARRFGVHLPSRESSPAQKQESEKREALFQINQIASDFFHDLLTRRKEGEGARRYLAGRGISKMMIDEHHLGYSLDRWDGLVQHLREKKIPLQMASELGLIIPKSKDGWYDTFRGRVTFPIWDLHERVVGLGGRVTGEGQPKYLNSPESIIYHKGEILYGFPVARTFIREKDSVIIVEGYFDLLTLHQYGMRHSVATLGTALTAHHLRILKRYTKNIVTVFDGDQAGLQASLRALPLSLEEEIWAKTVTLPEGEDPDGFLRKGHLEDFEKKVSEGTLLIDFFFDHLTKTHGVKSIEGRVKVAEEGVAMIRRIPNEIRRNFYLRALAGKLDLDESLLLGKLERYTRGRVKTSEEVKRQLSPGAFPRSEEMVIRLMVHQPELIRKVSDEKIVDEFESPILQRIARTLEDFYQQKRRLDLKEVMGCLEEDLRGRLREIAFQEDSLSEGIQPKVLDDCIRKIHEKRLRKEKSELRKKISEAERQEGGKVPETLLAEHWALAKRASGLRKSSL
jgi:DNA primase